LKSYGFTIKIRGKKEAEKYILLHKSVWPEVHDALDEIGVLSVQIFIIDDIRLFMHMETIDDFSPYESFKKAMLLHKNVQLWDDIMHGTLLKRDEKNSGSTEWANMEFLYCYENRKFKKFTSIDECLISYGFMIHFKDPKHKVIYKDMHKTVWLEVIESFKTIGIETMQIYFMPDDKLFMYIEANEHFEYVRDFKGYVHLHPKVKEWDELFSTMLKRVKSNTGITDWAHMKKIYGYDRREYRTLFGKIDM